MRAIYYGSSAGGGVLRIEASIEVAVGVDVEAGRMNTGSSSDISMVKSEIYLRSLKTDIVDGADGGTNATDLRRVAAMNAVGPAAADGAFGGSRNSSPRLFLVINNFDRRLNACIMWWNVHSRWSAVRTNPSFRLLSIVLCCGTEICAARSAMQQ